MKKQFISFMLIIACFSASAQKNVIKVNPLGLLFGSASVSYERVLTPKSAFQVNALYGNLSFSDFSYSSFGAGVDYRIYLSKTKEAPVGFYVSPGLAYNNLTFAVLSDKATVSSFALKGLAGYQWVWGGFDLDLFGGFNYSFGGNVSLNGSNYGVSGFGPALGVSIGYAF